MTTISINLDGMGDSGQVFFEWLDENGLKHELPIEVEILNQDKPRTLRLTIGGVAIVETTNNTPLKIRDTRRLDDKPPANKIPPPTEAQLTYERFEGARDTPNWLRSGRHG